MRNQYKVLAEAYSLVKEDGGHDQNLPGNHTNDGTMFKKPEGHAYKVRGKFKLKGKYYDYEAIVGHNETGMPMDVLEVSILQLQNDTEPVDMTNKFRGKMLKKVKDYILTKAQEDPELQLPNSQHDGNKGYSFVGLNKT